MPVAKRAARKSAKAAPKKRTPAKAPAKGTKKTPVKKTTASRKAPAKKKEAVDPSTVFGTPEWRARYMKPKRKKRKK